MVDSKGWEWEKANQSPWLRPTDDVYYLANKWLELGFKNILDLFHNFDIERIRHIDYCYLNYKKLDCKYYYINGCKK